MLVAVVMEDELDELVADDRAEVEDVELLVGVGVGVGVVGGISR